MAVIFITVDSSSWGENEILTRILLHNFKQIHRPSQIILEVHDRLVHGLAYSLFGSKMHNTVNGFTLLYFLFEQSIKIFKIKDVNLMKLYPRLNLFFCWFSRQDFLDPFQYIIEAVREIIDNDDIGFSFLEDLDNSMRAYEAKSSRDKQIVDHYNHFLKI